MNIGPIRLHCPYCGERFDTAVDAGDADQHYVEDCAVCCRPIDVRIAVAAGGEWMVSARRDDEAS